MLKKSNKIRNFLEHHHNVLLVSYLHLSPNGIARGKKCSKKKTFQDFYGNSDTSLGCSIVLLTKLSIDKMKLPARNN